ncbi:MAG: hypothetical protein R2705_08615 [Ilumatobacteraceae bacterium]
MADERWGRGAKGEGDDAWAELSDPVFADDDTDGAVLNFGSDDTGPLPHWTAPPTGEVPRSSPTRIRPTVSTCGRVSRNKRRSGATRIDRTRPR